MNNLHIEVKTTSYVCSVFYVNYIFPRSVLRKIYFSKTNSRSLERYIGNLGALIVNAVEVLYDKVKEMGLVSLLAISLNFIKLLIGSFLYTAGVVHLSPDDDD